MKPAAHGGSSIGARSYCTMKRGFLNGSKVKKNPLYEPPPANDTAKEAIHDQKAPQATLDDGKLPYGKVENRGAPKDYEVSKVAYTEIDPTMFATNPDQVVVTTIPRTYLDKPFDPDGHSVWIVLGPTKGKVVGRPGYLKGLPKPSGPPAYEVKTVPNMGMGIFATRDIAVGELVFAERPLLVAPLDLSPMAGKSAIKLRDKYTPDEFKQILMLECEKHLDFALAVMLPENRQAYLALANDHKEDGSGPLLGILRTNGYMIKNLFDGPNVDEWQSNVYTGITNVGSRINHSYKPNIAHKFDLDSFGFSFIAKRDIPSGEQLCYSYCPVEQSAADRKADLARYGFACTCPSCANPTPESDKLRTECRPKILAAAVAVSRGVANKAVFEALVDLKNQMVEEGLQATDSYHKLLKIIFTVCVMLGMTDEKSTYLKEMKKYGLY
ncbi:SET domain-containing protein [Agrocybe pediades]|nr:SET domain-containing protein [Agrocybe pediades]KAF9546668.1 SET domain-containing protein [Agrocybe pediades]